MLIAQLSDPHLKARNVHLFGHVDTAAHLHRAVDHVNSLQPQPDAVIVSGDLVNDGHRDEYELAREELDRLVVPYLPIVGNHDAREPFRDAFAHLGRLPAEGPLAYRADIGRLTILLLDSLVDGQPHGAIHPGQLTWLDGELADCQPRPTLVAVHHPPFATGLRAMDAIGLQRADDLAGIIARYDHVERVLAGHVHRTIQTRFAGTVAMTAPGCAHQLALDLTDGDNATWRLEPPAILLHLWTEPAGVTSHVSFIDDYGPQRRFSNAHAWMAPR